jgi:hypothetical protein
MSVPTQVDEFRVVFEPPAKVVLSILFNSSASFSKD